MTQKRKTMKEYICDQCGKKFIFNANDRQEEHHFCNMECYTKWRTGRKREGFVQPQHSQKWKDVHNKRMQGNQYRKGIPHTEEDKRKMSEGVRKNLAEHPEIRKQRSENARGEHNPNWRGGSAKLEFEEAFGITIPEWDAIAKEVRERDGFICQYCGKPRSTNVHHIIPRRIGIDNQTHNLITLCSSCHFLVEHKTSNCIEDGIDPITIFYEAWSQ